MKQTKQTAAVDFPLLLTQQMAEMFAALETCEERAEFMRAIFEYHFNGAEIELEKAPRTLFSLIRQKIDVNKATFIKRARNFNSKQRLNDGE